MTLLDRFRAPSPDKHSDPAVRLQFVQELPLDYRDTIAAFARDDADPTVRRAAVAKLLSPALLGPIARDDSDGAVRAQALNMLRDLALESFEGTTEADSLAAVDELVAAADAHASERLLADIAKTSTRVAVIERALARIAVPRLLGSIARHAAVETGRREAFERLRGQGETAEIMNIALNGEHKDVSVAAVDLFTDRADLQQIAVRSRNKSAARRAAGLVREMDERAAREAAEAAEAARRAAEAERQRQRASMGETVSPAPTSALEVEAETQREHDDAAVQQAAVAAERAKEEAAARAVALAESLRSVAEEAAAVASLEPVTEASARFAPLRKRWTALSSGSPVDPDIAARFANAELALRAREQEVREADAKARHDAWQRVQNLVTRVEPLSSKGDLTLKAAERALRDVRTVLADPPALPIHVDGASLLARLSTAHDALVPKVNELREADEWQKWANVAIQEQLCVKMEALATVEDAEAVARQVRELQQQWRAAADVPRGQADALWGRFKAAHDVAWTRCETYYAKQSEERAENLAHKIALCDQVGALADSTQWIQTAETIKTLQAEWKTIGPVPRGREKEIWDRFRTSCDRFFTRRHEDLVARKAVWAENLAKKDALCTRVEALADSTDWDATGAEIKRIQAEWRTIGPVKKSRSEAIWQRFRAACDRFFERYAHRYEAARAERVAAREAICAELENLAPPVAGSASSPDDTPETRETRRGDGASETPTPLTPDALLARVRAIRVRWRQELALRGVDPDRARALDARFAAALGRLHAAVPAAFAGTELDQAANERRMEALVKKVEDLARTLAGPAGTADAALSPSNRLAAMLKEALAANAIGGRVDNDARYRAASADLAQAQEAWSHLGEVPDEIRRPLAERFQRAARQITDKTGAAHREGARPHGGPPSGSRPREGRRPGPGPDRRGGPPTRS